VKQQIKKDYLAYMARFASPHLSAIRRKIAVDFPVSDSFANPTPDENGHQQYLTPDTSYGNSPGGWKNAYYVVLTGGSKVDVVEQLATVRLLIKLSLFIIPRLPKESNTSPFTNEGQAPEPGGISDP
jgi:hypothetical protein